MGRGGGGRFVQVGIFVKGGCKGGIWIPEGRNGCGWRQFAGELRVMPQNLYPRIKVIVLV